MFAWQIPMRNQLLIYIYIHIIKRGKERWLKSSLARGLRTDKYRYIEAARVISYRFLSVGRLLRRFFGLKWDYREACKAKNIPRDNLTATPQNPLPCFGPKTVAKGSPNASQNGCKSNKNRSLKVDQGSMMIFIAWRYDFYSILKPKRSRVEGRVW